MDQFTLIAKNFIFDNKITSAFVFLTFSILIINIVKSRLYYNKYIKDLSFLTTSLNTLTLASNSKTQLDKDGLSNFCENIEKTFLYYLKNIIIESSVSYRNSNDIYFNSDTLYKELNVNTFTNEHIQNQKLMDIPTILVSIGVLGTFLGLILGISSASSGLASSDSNVARASLEDLLGGAGLAFTTSLAGLGCSLVFNIILVRQQSKVSTIWTNFTNMIKKSIPIISSKHEIRASNNIEELLEISKIVKDNNFNLLSLQKESLEIIRLSNIDNMALRKQQLELIEKKLDEVNKNIRELRDEKEFY